MARTVQTVRALIREGGTHPHVIDTARRIVAPVPERDQSGEVEALFDWVRRGSRFVSDPVRAETLTDPVTQLGEIQRHGKASGDCDDHTVLLGALLEAVGYEAEPVIESYRKDREPSHIALQTQADGRRIHLDPTVKDRPMGTHAGAPTRAYRHAGDSMIAIGSPALSLSGGVAESLTGQNEDSAWGSFFAGLQDAGDWAMRSPFANQWVMKNQISSARDVAKLNKKFGWDVYSSLYGDPANATERQLQARAEQRASSPGENGDGDGEVPAVAIIGIAAAAGIALLLLLR